MLAGYASALRIDKLAVVACHSVLVAEYLVWKIFCTMSDKRLCSEKLFGLGEPIFTDINPPRRTCQRSVCVQLTAAKVVPCCGADILTTQTSTPVLLATDAFGVFMHPTINFISI